MSTFNQARVKRSNRHAIRCDRRTYMFDQFDEDIDFTDARTIMTSVCIGLPNVFGEYADDASAEERRMVDDEMSTPYYGYTHRLTKGNHGNYKRHNRRSNQFSYMIKHPF